MQKNLLFCAVLPSSAILEPFKNGDGQTELDISDISIKETTNLPSVHPKSPARTFLLLRTSKLVSITVRPLSFKNITETQRPSTLQGWLGKTFWRWDWERWVGWINVWQSHHVHGEGGNCGGYRCSQIEKKNLKCIVKLRNLDLGNSEPVT